MPTHPNEAAPQGLRSPWLQIIRSLLLAALVIALFLLGQSMVRHRFFRKRLRMAVWTRLNADRHS